MTARVFHAQSAAGPDRSTHAAQPRGRWTLRWIGRMIRRALTAMMGLLLIAALPVSCRAEGVWRCGTDIVLATELGELPAGGLHLAVPRLGAKSGTTIILNAGAGLRLRADALAAWESAVATWEALLTDPVTIVLQGDLELLEPGVLGATTPRGFLDVYGNIRNAMAIDAATNEQIASQLPTSSQVALMMPPGFSFGGQMAATKANFKALGFDMSFDDAYPDASIVFSTRFLSQFDFDPSDGIDPGKIDFEAVVVHEIGHALGFTSFVDAVDYLRYEGLTMEIQPYPLDLFRLLPGAGAVDFTGASRVLTTGDLAADQVFFDGADDLAMSTGVKLGDGNQASHWQANEIGGVYIGIMDPTLAAGVREEMTDADLRAFGLLGWDVDPDGDGEPQEPEPPRQDLPPVAVTQVYPNPFNPETNIEFSLPEDTDVRLDIFDPLGRLVVTLLREYRVAGPHSVVWTGVDAFGAPLGSGVYLLRLSSALGDDTRKLMLLK